MTEDQKKIEEFLKRNPKKRVVHTADEGKKPCPFTKLIIEPSLDKFWVKRKGRK